MDGEFPGETVRKSILSKSEIELLVDLFSLADIHYRTLICNQRSLEYIWREKMYLLLVLREKILKALGR